MSIFKLPTAPRYWIKSTGIVENEGLSNKQRDVQEQPQCPWSDVNEHHSRATTDIIDQNPVTGKAQSWVPKINLFFTKQNERAVSFRTKVDQNSQTEIEFQSQFKNYKCVCYPTPSDTIKHSLETSQLASLELSFNVLII